MEFENIIEKMFDSVFMDKLTHTIERRRRGIEYVENLMYECLEYAILQFYLEEICQGQRIDIHDLPAEIEGFLLNLDKVKRQELVGKFNQKGIPLFLEKFAESFFVNNIEDIMAINHDHYTFIGPEQETLSTLYIASHFLAKAFAKSGFKLEGARFFDTIQFNPNNIKGTLQKVENFFELIGGQERLKDILKELNNGVEFQEGTSNRRIYDLLFLIIDGYINLNFPCKNTRDIQLAERYIFKNIAVDTFSTIFPALFLQLDNPDSNIETQIESMIIAIEDGDRASALKIYNEIEAINTIVDFAHKNNKRKNPTHMEFYFTVARLINEKLNDDGKNFDSLAKVRNSIKQYFSDPTFQEKILQEAQKIFGKSNVDSDLIVSAELLFGVIGNLEKLMRKDVSGQYRFFWTSTYQIYLPTTDKLSRADLPDDISFEVKDNNVVDLRRTNEPMGQMMFVYHKDGRKGIASANLINKLPDGIYVGYKLNYQKVIKNALITDSKGYRLIGEITIENKKVRKISDSEFKELINDRLQSYQLEIKGQKVNGFTLNYYRCAMWEAGSRLTVFLQEIESYVIPTREYEGRFENTLLKRSMKARKYFKFSDNPIYEEFTSEKMIKVFFNLFDFRRSIVPSGKGPTRVRRGPNPFVTSMLGFLNMRLDIGSGNIDLSLVRDNLLIEGILNKIFGTNDDIRNFLSRDVDGEPDLSISFKEWLEFMRYKIISTTIDINDKSEAARLIKSAQDDLRNIPNLDTSPHHKDKFYTKEELKNGIIILNTILKTIGTRTIIFLLLHMVEIYNSDSGYKIEINQARSWNDISRFLEHYGIRASTQRLKGPLGREAVGRHLFSLTCLNSRIELSVDSSIIDPDNTIEFGYAPLAFILNDFSRYSLKRFDTHIMNLFFASYKEYFKNVYNLNYEIQDLEHPSMLEPGHKRNFAEKGTNQLKFNFLMDSASNVIPKLIKIIEPQIINNYGRDRAQNILNKIFLELYEDYTTGGSRIGSGIGLQAKYIIRHQIEDLLLSNDFKRYIKFHRVLVDGNPVTIELERDRLLGVDLKFWGADTDILKSEIDAKSINNKIIKGRVRILASIIKSNGGKVRIYTTIGIDNDNYGIQYIKPDIRDEKFKYLDRPSDYEELEPHYFEIDFNKDELNALRTLEKIVGLSMSFSTQPGPGLRDFLFIVKGVDSTGNFLEWNYDKMICAFNGRKFFTHKEIFSPNKYIIKHYNYGYEKVNIEGSEGIFNLKRANDLWTAYGFYIPFNVNSGSFTDYFNEKNSFYK